MKDTFWIVYDKGGVVDFQTIEEPKPEDLQVGQHVFRMDFEVPDEFFKPIVGIVDVRVPLEDVQSAREKEFKELKVAGVGKNLTSRIKKIAKVEPDPQPAQSLTTNSAPQVTNSAPSPVANAPVFTDMINFTGETLLGTVSAAMKEMRTKYMAYRNFRRAFGNPLTFKAMQSMPDESFTLMDEQDKYIYCYLAAVFWGSQSFSKAVTEITPLTDNRKATKFFRDLSAPGVLLIKDPNKSPRQYTVPNRNAIFNNFNELVREVEAQCVTRGKQPAHPFASISTRWDPHSQRYFNVP